MLHNYNAKNAQFRILPQYKVKSEGEVVSSVLYGTVTIKNRKSTHMLENSITEVSTKRRRVEYRISAHIELKTNIPNNDRLLNKRDKVKIICT